MRQHLIVALALAVASPAAGQAPTKPGEKPKPIDMKAMAGKLDVFRDEDGKYYVSPNYAAFEKDRKREEELEKEGKKVEEKDKVDPSKWVFYGDAKAMYQQRIVGSGSDGQGYDWSVWSPRVRGMNQASFSAKSGSPSVGCKQRDNKPLKLLTVDEAKAVLQRATFLPPLWQRVDHFLARDDDGTYWYVDRYRRDLGGKGHRVFSGQKGAMKELAMTNVVSDSAGEIYKTKTGDLKIVTESGTGKAYWKKGEAKTELVMLDVDANRYLIYRELGIYGQLGVICDDE